jgi:hypothetical protein
MREWHWCCAGCAESGIVKVVEDTTNPILRNIVREEHRDITPDCLGRIFMSRDDIFAFDAKEPPNELYLWFCPKCRQYAQVAAQDEEEACDLACSDHDTHVTRQDRAGAIKCQADAKDIKVFYTWTPAE